MHMDTTLHAALVAVAGKAATTGSAVTPTSASQVPALLRAMADHRARVRLTSGPAPRGETGDVAVVLSLAGLGSLEVDASAMVARAEAGVTIAALRAAVEGSRLAVAGVLSTPSPVPTHVGSAVARGGLPRRALCGIEAVLATGEVVRAGGLVQRDVAGYDLPSLLLGSAGRLAVITAVYVRLIPAGTRLEAHEPAGVATPGTLAAAVVRAFDPDGVLAGR